jgi:hypothetical protein
VSPAESRRRVALALSILNNAGQVGTSRAVVEARMALEGATLQQLADFRCHGDLGPNTYCGRCGACTIGVSG